jgi:hypothetical protein
MTAGVWWLWTMFIRFLMGYGHAQVCSNLFSPLCYFERCMTSVLIMGLQCIRGILFGNKMKY